MQFGTPSEMLQKALCRNSREKKRGDLKNETIEKDYHRSLFTITKSIIGMRSTLRDIKATTGHSKEAWTAFELLPPATDTTVEVSAGEKDTGSVTLETDEQLKPRGNVSKDKRDEQEEPDSNCDSDVIKLLKHHNEVATDKAKVRSGEKELMCPGKWDMKGLKHGIPQHSSVTAWNLVPKVTKSLPVFNEVLVQNNGWKEKNQIEKRIYSPPSLAFATPNILGENEGSMKENREKAQNISELKHQSYSAKQKPRMQADPSILQENELKSKRPGSQPTVFPGISYQTRSFPNKGGEKSFDRVNRQPPPVAASSVPSQGTRSQSAPISRTFAKAQFKSAPISGVQNRDPAEKFSDVSGIRSTSTSTRHYQNFIYISTANLDRGKVQIKATLSKKERKRILEHMISDYKSMDKTILEKERQRLLQEKITAFIASLKQHCKKTE